MPYAYTALENLYTRNNCECKAKMEGARDWAERSERRKQNWEESNWKNVQENILRSKRWARVSEWEREGKYLKTYWINSIENMYGFEQCAETVTSLIMLSIVWITM